MTHFVRNSVDLVLKQHTHTQ